VGTFLAIGFLPILYVLSIGPALWLGERDIWLRHRPVATLGGHKIMRTIYAPATYALKKCEPLFVRLEDKPRMTRRPVERPAVRPRPNRQVPVVTAATADASALAANP
jgi:hypothetical protein